MRIHILGIGGTFMAGVALLAKQTGYEVIGMDENLYPPMSTQLEKQGITVINGYDPNKIDPAVDKIIVGNVIKRGNPAMEWIMEKGLAYISGPQWLAENILKDRIVIAVAGTHGKTTTTSLLAWILAYAGKDPSFLIGGVPENFGVSAKIGSGSHFVIEADEYDSAFFDKRAKFIHYHPQILILNNLEYDHADIFPHLEAIQQQFHYLVRTVPGNGSIICHALEPNLQTVLNQGCWTPVTTFHSNDWGTVLLKNDGSAFQVLHSGKNVGKVAWNLLGHHNVSNALAAIIAAVHAGVAIETAIAALSSFKNVKRRLEIKYQTQGITIYDDFAHHPTAIATTLAGLRAKVGDARIIVVLEFGSYTMRHGVHQNSIKNALTAADVVLLKQPDSLKWNLDLLIKEFTQPAFLFNNVDVLVNHLVQQLKSGDHVVVMSNAGFDGIHQKLQDKVEINTLS